MQQERTMLNILREAQERFKEIHNLLETASPRNGAYFTHLNIASEEAYVLMNEGMCANSSVCHECAEHRDFIRSILDILSTLETNSSNAESYAETFIQYSERVNKILKNIATVLAS